MNEQCQTKFFFFVTAKGEKSVQMWAHITSAVSILYVLDLLFDFNPLKDAVRSVLPAIDLSTSSN
jgi:hypothetical protein